MHYPVAVERGTADAAYGVVVPDLPGCFSAGDTYQEALTQAREAIELHVEHLLDEGQPVPPPSTLDELADRPEYAGWIWALVELRPEALDETVERVNISVPRRVLRAIDDEAERHGESRSEYLANAALMRRTAPA